jgi:N-hydroxyarylamine O-acetyltransferase
MKDRHSSEATMPYPPMRPDLLERYLGLLGVSRGTPGPERLRELVQAHLCRIPFENVSKLYYKRHLGLRGLPSLELFLDGIDHFNFGGTCYTNNYYFYQLLANLGYQAMLCGADMSNPDVHVVSMVELEKRQYLVDVGYAAPFVAPLPRDLATDYVIRLGRDRYVLKPQDAEGRSRLELYRDGILKHGYVAKPVPRQIGEFEPVIAASFRDEATFMKALLLARFFPGRSLVIHNLAVIESQAAEANVRTVANRSDLVQVIWECFGIPPRITRDVVDGLGQLGDAWN